MPHRGISDGIVLVLQMPAESQRRSEALPEASPAMTTSPSGPAEIDAALQGPHPLQAHPPGQRVAPQYSASVLRRIYFHIDCCVERAL